MSEPLESLVGMALLSAQTDNESAGLEFSGCSLSAYSRYSSSRPLQSLVGLTVKSISFLPEQSFVINLSGGEYFTVSLAPNDYVGPEAFSARFTGGPWVVE